MLWKTGVIYMGKINDTERVSIIHQTYEIRHITTNVG